VAHVAPGIGAPSWHSHALLLPHSIIVSSAASQPFCAACSKAPFNNPSHFSDPHGSPLVLLHAVWTALLLAASDEVPPDPAAPWTASVCVPLQATQRAAIDTYPRLRMATEPITSPREQSRPVAPQHHSSAGVIAVAHDRP